MNTHPSLNSNRHSSIDNPIWWQKKVKGWVVPFWFTDTPLYSKRAVVYGFDKLAKSIREQRYKRYVENNY